MKLFFDTETSGLPARGQYDNPTHPQTPHLVEIAGLLTEDDGTVVSAYQAIVKPIGFEIDPKAAALHGITQQRAMDEGVILSEALENFRGLYNQADQLIAHNLKFDKLIILGEMYRLSGRLVSFNKECFCTMLESTDWCNLPGGYGGRPKWPKLDECYQKEFGRPIRGAHRAMTDVEHMYQFYFKHFYGINVPLPSAS